MTKEERLKEIARQRQEFEKQLDDYIARDRAHFDRMVRMRLDAAIKESEIHAKYMPWLFTALGALFLIFALERLLT